MTRASPYQERQIAPARAAVERLLDTVCASAQPAVVGGSLEFRWGQFITDDIGDVVGQFGVHGTAQAVLALAAGQRLLGATTRFAKFLLGGIDALRRVPAQPYKSYDMSRTLKVAQLLAALGDGGLWDDTARYVLAILLEARDPSSGAWGFTLKRDTTPHWWSTAYVLDALCRCARHTTELRSVIEMGFDYVFRSAADRYTSKDWACLYNLCEAIHAYQSATPASDLSIRFRRYVSRDDTPHPDPETSERAEYRVLDESGRESAAFFVLPSGLLRFRTDLWLLDASDGRSNAALVSRSKATTARVWSTIFAPSGWPVRGLRDYSYLCRIFSDYHAAFDRVGDVPIAVGTRTPANEPADGPEIEDERPESDERAQHGGTISVRLRARYSGLHGWLVMVGSLVLGVPYFLGYVIDILRIRLHIGAFVILAFVALRLYQFVRVRSEEFVHLNLDELAGIWRREKWLRWLGWGVIGLILLTVLAKVDVQFNGVHRLYFPEWLYEGLGVPMPTSEDVPPSSPETHG